MRIDARSSVEPSPGVSIRVIDSSLADGQPTSMRSMSSTSCVPRSISSSPSCRLKSRSRVALGPQVGGHPIPEPVPVPRHDPGALPGVGGSEALTDQRVQQRRLAGLHATGDRDAKRFIEASHDGIDGRGLDRSPGRLPGPARRSRGPRSRDRSSASAYEGRSKQLPVFWMTEWSCRATRTHICDAPVGRSLTL